MSDAAARFAARYPVVWHVMEADGAGPWVAKTGLFPAAEIYRFAGLQPDGANRDTFQQIDFGSGRTAILRLQQMRDNKLWQTAIQIGTETPKLPSASPRATAIATT